VLVLLPPSEGKTAPAAGPRLDLDELSLPELTGPRRTAIDSLVTLCRTQPEAALGILGLSARQVHEVERNAGLEAAPTAPAWQVYTGVLFEALDIPSANPRARERLMRWVLVWSGLWGAVGLDDPIPAYRLSGSVILPGPGRLAFFWREPLRRAMAEVTTDQVILDLRSGTYSASWAGPAERTAVVRVIHEQGERRTAASHFNKSTKGRLLAALAAGDAEPSSVAELVDAIEGAGFRVETGRPSGAGRSPKPRILDVVVASL
jgi:cytoplasmic iron level regulating protein YaaA (DUF328/UPF0246 family)